jgi:hypothetical protein
MMTETLAEHRLRVAPAVGLPQQGGEAVETDRNGAMVGAQLISMTASARPSLSGPDNARLSFAKSVPAARLAVTKAR